LRSSELQFSSLEQLLRYDRKIVAMSLFLASLLCWTWIFSAGIGVANLASASWTTSTVVLMFFMWWIMMIAMMLPSATPVILLASALNRREPTEKQPFASSGVFVTGYLLAWASFSAIAVALQRGMQNNGLISGLLNSQSSTFSAILLIAAGAWQFMPFKYTYLQQHRSPIDFLSRQNRQGTGGALIVGIHHGMYCMGCCWFLLLILFVGSAMNLLWIAGLAAYVWVERFLPSGETAGRVMGGLLIAWGTGILL
jgi:predicted metal-binding membrane protein